MSEMFSQEVLGRRFIVWRNSRPGRNGGFLYWDGSAWRRDRNQAAYLSYEAAAQVVNEQARVLGIGRNRPEAPRTKPAPGA